MIHYKPPKGFKRIRSKDLGFDHGECPCVSCDLNNESKAGLKKAGTDICMGCGGEFVLIKESTANFEKITNTIKNVKNVLKRVDNAKKAKTNKINEFKDLYDKYKGKTLDEVCLFLTILTKTFPKSLISFENKNGITIELKHYKNGFKIYLDAFSYDNPLSRGFTRNMLDKNYDKKCLVHSKDDEIYIYQEATGGGWFTIGRLTTQETIKYISGLVVDFFKEVV